MFALDVIICYNYFKIGEVVIMFDNVLKTSLAAHKIITIMYQKGDEFTQRNIKIIKIEENNVEAYCYLRHEVRHFKKSNILAAMYTH
jgi:predicted DNA-binding transcriptional regulator YafY